MRQHRNIERYVPVVPRRSWTAPLALAMATGAAGLLVAAPPAGAHGFFYTPALPIPVWLFYVIAVLVVVLSFAATGFLWSASRLDDRHWRPTRLRLGPGGLAAAEFVAGAIGVLVLFLVIYSGLAGEGRADRNFAAIWVFVIFWAGIPLLQVAIGDVFSAFNPWRAIGRFVSAAAALYVRAPAGQEPQPLLRYPERLGRLPALAGLLAFAYLELASSRTPNAVGESAAIYTAVTFAGMALFGTRAWMERGETFSVYFGLYARISAVEVRDGTLGIRRPLSALADLPPARGTVVFLAVMIGTVSLDGAGGTPEWQDVLRWITGRLSDVGLSVLSAEQWANFVGVLLFSLAAFLFYYLGVLGMRAVGGGRSISDLAHRFAPPLVPIALAYLLAHNFTQLLIGGQSIIPVLSDPFENGADLLGTRDFVPDQGFLSPEFFWYLEVGAVVVGHVAAILLAHDIALRTFERARQATRSQYFMLVVMVGFTVFALWLLKQASEL